MQNTRNNPEPLPKGRTDSKDSKTTRAGKASIHTEQGNETMIAWPCTSSLETYAPRTSEIVLQASDVLIS